MLNRSTRTATGFHFSTKSPLATIARAFLRLCAFAPLREILFL
jgi:hypothetical protein